LEEDIGRGYWKRVLEEDIGRGYWKRILEEDIGRGVPNLNDGSDPCVET
jgi:hypothetical protein